MKTVVGFTFTDSVVQQLQEAGFSLQQNDQTLKNGYKEFLCCFHGANLNQLHIEIREVIDEVLYFDFQKQKNFAPFENSHVQDAIQQDHPNKAYVIQELIKIENVNSDSLKQYFEIKKKYPIWALWLKCEDLEYFERAKNLGKFVEWHNHKAFHISLGPSCFDLLITT